VKPPSFRRAGVLLLLPVLVLCAVLGWAVFRSQESPATLPQEANPKSEVPGYTYRDPSPDGIGKIFHGREIAKVMGHPAIGWLERNEREREEAPSRAIDALALSQDATIADIGAGSGYYSFRIAPKVPDGRVIAIDIQPEMVDFLKSRAAELGIANVIPHLGGIEDLKLPAASLDAALLVDAYHEFSHPAEMLDSLFRSIRPGGRIFLLEFRAEDPRVPIKPLHKMTEEQARLEFESAGFRFVSNRRQLPWQHFMVFEKPAND
jgi:ubiquinone/menaquinone biosynthesis C-methylase UbiE